ncbi:MAG TPA: glycine oxidase ThiO [Solirubrobacteraceae bacterium]
MAVVGGGVVGLAVAWRAAQRGIRVVVLERGDPGTGASWVAAGMIAPISEARPKERSLLALSLASAQAYPRFVAELREASGLDPGYLGCGTLAVARDRDEAEALERELVMREGLGLAASRLRPSEARRLEPALAPTVRFAIDVPGDHVIDPHALVAALGSALIAAGGSVRSASEVTEVVVHDGRVRGVRLASGEQIAAEQVVIAAGVWSDSIAGLPDHARVPLRAVKGQTLRMHDPSGPGLLTRVLRMSPGYVVPRGDGRYVLGATMEERGFDTTITAGAIFEQLRDAIELVPGIAELVIDGLVAGLRPGTPDNAPVLGPGAVEGLQWATGHYRHGILLAPITADVLAATLAGEGPTELAAPFGAGRFARATVGA